MNKTGILSGSPVPGGQNKSVEIVGILIFLLDELAGIRHLFSNVALFRKVRSAMLSDEAPVAPERHVTGFLIRKPECNPVAQ